MQIMPPTWQELRIKSASATTVVNRVTICFARTAYLREKLDRFCCDGVFAAYNSNPGDIKSMSRSAVHRCETVDYARKRAPLIIAAVPIPMRSRRGCSTAGALHRLVFARRGDTRNVVTMHGDRGGHVTAETVFAAIHPCNIQSAKTLP